MRAYLGRAVCDAGGVSAAPGAVAVEQGRVVAAGDPQAVLAACGKDVACHELGDVLLLPGLVNAHTHLDLTDLGYRPFQGEFVAWVEMVMTERPTEASAIRAAVSRGVALNRAAGVLTIGDIAASGESMDAFIASALRGVTFFELIGHDASVSDETFDVPTPDRPGVRVGWQPHAPYSTPRAVFDFATMAGGEVGHPIATHLAETRQELEFVATGGGVFRTLLEQLGKWNETVAKQYGDGRHPVRWLLEGRVFARPQTGWLCAHCNYVDDSHIDLLAQHGASVAYCPRAAEYFGHEGHRYRDMLEAGVNVCLGTDSIICSGTLSVLDEMRRLRQRDGTDASVLLKMATVNGMKALRLNSRDATFADDAAAGLIAVDYDGRCATGQAALEQVLSTRAAPGVRVLELPA